MKAVCFQQVEEVACRDINDATIEVPTDAVVQVELAGLCGSDLHAFHGRETGLDVGTVMGHELVGKVVEVGQGVSQIQPGDRVYTPFTTSCGKCFYCQRGLTARCEFGQLFGWVQDNQGLHGGQSEYVRVPLADGTLKKMPPELSAESALLLGDNFSTAYFCAEMAQLDSAGVYVVVGCGTVGLLTVLAAQVLGAEKLFAYDPVPQRLSKAEQLGATVVSDIAELKALVLSASEGRGADSVMEVVGLPAAQQLAFDLLRPGGILSVVGCHCTPDFAFSPIDAFDKNLAYRVGRCPARHYMELLTDKVASGSINLDGFITHRFAPDDCVNAYDIFSNRRDGCLKAAFEFT